MKGDLMKTRLNGRKRCFKKRKYWMKKLGFGTYKNYLKSDVWKDIRKKVLIKRKFKCYFCKGKATEVHHLRYTRPVLLGKKHFYGGLVATCSPCHKKISLKAKLLKIHEDHAYQIFNIETSRATEMMGET